MKPSAASSPLGAGVKIVKEGDRVGVPWLYSACGHCEYCLSAWETVCAEAEFGGYTKNGGFAEYLIADPNYVAHIPASSTPSRRRRSSAPASPPTRASRRPRPRPANGSSSPALAASDISPFNTPRSWASRSAPSISTTANWRWPRQLGADLVVNAKHADAARLSRRAPNGGAHGVLITAPSLSAFKQGVGMTRKRGTCVLVGLPPGDFPVPLFDVVANCITIRGSFVGNREDMAETLAFAAEGKVKADIELQPLSAINAIFDRLEHGKVAGRVVLDFVGASAEEPLTKAATKKVETAAVH